MSVAIAAFVAGLFAVVELRSRLRSAPTRKGRALWWWAARLALEIALSLVALSAIHELIDKAWAQGAVGAALAGAAGPAVARLQVITVGKGDESKPFGLASIYEPLRNYVEDQIDEIGAEQESVFINEVVLPRLKQQNKSPQDVGNRLSDFVTGLSDRRLPAASKKRELDFIDRTLADSVPNDQKIRVLVLRARQIGAYRTIRNFANL